MQPLPEQIIFQNVRIKGIVMPVNSREGPDASVVLALLSMRIRIMPTAVLLLAQVTKLDGIMCLKSRPRAVPLPRQQKRTRSTG